MKEFLTVFVPPLAGNAHVYCEHYWMRTGEPLNVYSNMAYLVTAILILLKRRETEPRQSHCQAVKSV